MIFRILLNLCVTCTVFFTLYRIRETVWEMNQNNLILFALLSVATLYVLESNKKLWIDVKRLWKEK